MAFSAPYSAVRRLNKPDGIENRGPYNKIFHSQFVLFFNEFFNSLLFYFCSMLEYLPA
jgi:hypothetical protein